MTSALTGALLAGDPSAAPPRSNPTAAENARPGNPGWSVRQAAFRSIEGYTSQVSAAPGDTVHFHVQTEPEARYRIELYRLGWYGGAGGRLAGCVPSCAGDAQGVPQPVPAFDPVTGVVRAGWPVTDTLTVPSDWVSGYYVAKLFLTTGPAAGKTATVPLIVREAPGRPAAILVQAPVNTWQAYDSWGGRSLYSSFDGVGSNRVSFDRPYVHGEQHVFEWEVQLVRFLEREGYDVSYTTSVDVDANPGELLHHRLVMTAGHDEYWTKGIRDGLEAARDAGTNLAFMGGNTGYWQMRYEDGRRTIVEYRIRGNDPEPDPALKTALFRLLGPPRPECTLLGVQWQQGLGFQTDLPVSDAALSDPWFAKSGFTPGSALSGLVGDEWDGVQPGCKTPPLTVFFHFPGAGDKGPADVTRYTASSGARVFDGSSHRFSWGLDTYGTELPGPDQRLQQFTRNALDDLTRPAAPIAVRAKHQGPRVLVEASLHLDARIRGIAAYRHAGKASFRPGTPGVRQVCESNRSRCLDPGPFPRTFRYAVVTRDRWGASFPTLSPPVKRR